MSSFSLTAEKLATIIVERVYSKLNLRPDDERFKGRTNRRRLFDFIVFVSEDFASPLEGNGWVGAGTRAT